MGKRRETRVVVSIPVRVCGIDQDGNPFTQTAQTVDVSRTGARLSGIRCLRGAGDMITIECGPNSARFLVVWIGQPGTDEDGMFGVKALQPEKRIFRVETGAPWLDGYVEPHGQPAKDPFTVQPVHAEKWDHSERRRAPRIRCAGTGQIRQRGVAFPVWAKLADLSSGGCYVEMVFTMSRGSEVDLKVTIGTRNFEAKGKVVTSHPGVGVGIKFTEVTQEHQKVLLEILQELTARKPRRPTDEPPTTSVI